MNRRKTWARGLEPRGKGGAWDFGPRPDEKRPASPARARLRQLLGLLTVRQREMLELRLGEELPFAACARLVGTGKSAAWRAFRRAIARIERHLGHRLRGFRRRRRRGGVRRGT